MKQFTSEKTLLFVHGASQPSEATFDLPIEGLSWMDYIAQHGWDVYLIDVRGYGRSTRPPEMDQPAASNPPIATTDVAVKDVGSAIDFILQRRGVSKLSLMGWSWGTVMMGAYTADHNDKVDRLVLYAPVWLSTAPPPQAAPPPLGAYVAAPMATARQRLQAGAPDDRKHVPLAAEFGMGILPWSPLAYGLLTGKYDRSVVEAAAPRAGGSLPRDAAALDEKRPEGDKRLDGANSFGDSLFTERNWEIVDVLCQIADETGHSAARIALSWVVNRPGITSTLMGVSRAEQVSDNAQALDVVLTDDHRAALDAVSSTEPKMLYSLFTPALRQHVIFGGSAVRT